MTTYYADSSALVKRYVTETGSNWVQNLCDPAAEHVIALTYIGLVEIAAALAMKTRQGVFSHPPSATVCYVTYNVMGATNTG